MHMETTMKTEFGNSELSTMVDSTVTSECGIQAASDTVCRGAQVTPLTRDAGCQYEDAPVPMTTARMSLSTPHIIRPSPIKQRAESSSPPSSQSDQAAFMAAKALQQLHQRPVIRSSKLCHTDRRNDLQTNNHPTGPNELTRLNLSTASNGAFSRPVKRLCEDREKVRFENREKTSHRERGGILFDHPNRDVELTRNSLGQGTSGPEKRGMTKGGDSRSDSNSKNGGAYGESSDNRPRAVQKPTEMGNVDLKFPARDVNSTSDNNKKTKPLIHSSNSAVKPSETDPIRTHLLDTNRFYRSHLWREVPAKTGPFRPVTPRHRQGHRDTDHTSWDHHGPTPRHIDNNRTDRAFRPVAPRRQRFHDPNSYPQSPPRCNSLISSPESILQTQIKALQSQSLHENVTNKEPGTGDALRGIGECNDSLMTLLQPGLMNSLPLTSYALLLDVINRQSLNSASNANLLNQINQLANKQTGRGHSVVSSNSVLKPTPTLLNTGGLCSASLVSSSLTSSALTSSALTSGALRNGGVLTPTTLPSPLLASSSPPVTLPHVGGFLNGINYIRSGTSPPVNIPTMLNRHTNGKRGLIDSSVNRDVDIESLVDSVIDEHMNNKPDSNSTELNDHMGGTKTCLYNRTELMNDYEMTPPFKRRRRTVFTEKQLQGLEEAYGKSQYLDRESRLELCKKLSLSLHTVVYWFQNKRAISRRRGQPMDNNGANSNSSSIENIHAYTSDNVKNMKTSPQFKRSPPHSPIQFGHYTASSSPIKTGSRPRVSPSAPTLLTSPPTAGLMSSPPSSVMSATLTSAISKNVLSMNQMVGATI